MTTLATKLNTVTHTGTTDAQAKKAAPILEASHKPRVISKLDDVTWHCKEDGILNTNQHVLSFHDQNFKDKDTYPKTTTVFIECIKGLLEKNMFWLYFKLDKTAGVDIVLPTLL